MKDFRPMLACKPSSLKSIRFPVLATPKIDGIRCVKIDGKVLSRNLKPIANDYVRDTLAQTMPDGVDGELTVPGNFHSALSGIMSKSGAPNFLYSVFDRISNETYKNRAVKLVALPIHPFVKILLPIEIKDSATLLVVEEEYVNRGYEGVIIRDPNGAYKFGRSTPLEQGMMKIKRKKEIIATVVGYEEEMENLNPKEDNELGLSKRSSHQDNLIPKQSLGALIVTHPDFEGTFKVGTGFTASQRKDYWIYPPTLLQQQVLISYFPHGVKDAPRHPVFKGFISAKTLTT